MNKQKCVKLFRYLVEQKDPHIEFIRNSNMLRHIIYLETDNVFDDDLKIELVKDVNQQIYYFQFKSIKLLIAVSAYNSLHYVFFKKYFQQLQPINKDDDKKLLDLYDKFLNHPDGGPVDEPVEEIDIGPLLPEIDPGDEPPTREDFIRWIEQEAQHRRQYERAERDTHSNEELSDEFKQALLKL